MYVNQEDKPQIIEDILKYYRKSWEDYDHSTLVEQTKDIQNRPKNAEKLSKEDLINLLIDDDRLIMEGKAYLELKDELFSLQNIKY